MATRDSFGFGVRCAFCALALTVWPGPSPVTAAIIELLPIADTTLISAAPDNNLGAQPFFNSGTTGPNAALSRARALLRFDPASHLPADAIVRSAELILEVVGEPLDAPVASEFRLYRLLRSWGEGTQSSVTSPGLGQPALEGEATWNHRFALTTNVWAAPGAIAGADYLETASAGQFVYGIDDSPYTFGSDPGLSTDVQEWLERPESNFGWILISSAESAPKTARRFGAREDALNSPRLLLDYDLPIRIEFPLMVEGRFQFEFHREPEQEYVVQSRSQPAGSEPWNVLTNVASASTAGRAVIIDALTETARYYRVWAP